MARLALLGIGLGNGSVRLNMLGTIVAAWTITIPIAALLAAIAYVAL